MFYTLYTCLCFNRSQVNWPSGFRAAGLEDYIWYAETIVDLSLI